MKSLIVLTALISLTASSALAQNPRYRPPAPTPAATTPVESRSRDTAVTPVQPPTNTPHGMPAQRRDQYGINSPLMTDEAPNAHRAHRLGFLVGVLSEPIPSLYGFNVAYNALDWLRFQAGIGFINLSDFESQVSTTTVTGEAQFLVPDFSFSPVGLVGIGTISGTFTGVSDNSTAGIKAGTGYFYVGGGLDWQTWAGFTLQLHFKYLITSVGSGGIPGLAVGWFF